MIKIENICKIFKSSNQEVKALDNINLTIEKGDIYGIIGLSGAGKSTLIRTLNRLEEPTSGHIFIGDTDLTGLSKEALRKTRQKIGMIFQHFNLLSSRTVADNIKFPLEVAEVDSKEHAKIVDALLKRVELEDKKDSYPSQLSGGQKQRVAIARALANKPSILLCDEATSALDPKTTKSILHLIKEINESTGITVILITHEMHVIKEICDKVAILENGQVIEEGPVEKVFSNPKTATGKIFISDNRFRKEVS